jgi:hypothetical protein
MKNIWNYLTAFSCLMVLLNLISTAQALTLGAGPNFLKSDYPDWRSPGMGVSLRYEQRLYKRFSVYVGGEVVSVNEALLESDVVVCIGECPEKVQVRSFMVQVPIGISFNLTSNKTWKMYLHAGYAFSHIYASQVKIKYKDNKQPIAEKREPHPNQENIHSGSLGLEFRKKLSNYFDLGVSTTLQVGNTDFGWYNKSRLLFQSQIRLTYHLFPAKSRG